MDSAQGREVFGDRYESAKQYVDILSSRGIDWGLIGPREVDRLWDRHILNSVGIAGLIPSGACVVDVGSGAGLPGIPLALLRPDLSVVLLEPLLRRATFLTDSVAELGLEDRVRVVRGRAEEHRSRYQVVTARAVAPLPRLIEWCLPLVAEGGELLALKGESAEAELATVTAELGRARVTASVEAIRCHPQVAASWVVRLRRQSRNASDDR